jgi:hypothetical protein
VECPSILGLSGALHWLHHDIWHLHNSEASSQLLRHWSQCPRHLRALLHAPGLSIPCHVTSHTLEAHVTHFDEVVLLLEELVGLLMTWHMGSWHILTYSYLDPLLPHALLVHMCHFGDYCTHVEAYCWIKGGRPFFSWRWSSVIHTPHVEALYHGSTCLI